MVHNNRGEYDDVLDTVTGPRVNAGTVQSRLWTTPLWIRGGGDCERFSVNVESVTGHMSSNDG